MSAILYTTYDPKTGLFLMNCKRSLKQKGSKPDLSDTPYVMGVHDIEKEYYNIKTGKVEPRPEFPFAKDTHIKLTTFDTLTIPDIPKGTRVCVIGQCYEVNDGLLEWQSPVPLTAHLYIECPPYIPVEIEVVVTES